MTDENKRIIEINGIKLEVDLRQAKTVDSYKVGDCVKVLVKEYSSFKPYPGVIVGFDAFENLPTIVVAYLDVNYSNAEIKFVYINSQNNEEQKCEIVPVNEADLAIEKGRAVELLDNKIETVKRELADLENKKKYFLKNFGKYFDKS